MYNPFEQIIERLNGIEEKIVNTVPEISNLPIEIISRNELCKRLAISEPTAIRWDKKGEIPSLRIGIIVRYNWPAVIQALENKQSSHHEPKKHLRILSQKGAREIKMNSKNPSL